LTKFRKRDEHELNDLPTEELIAYIVAAREAGELAAMRLAIEILAYRDYDNERGRVRMKMQRRPQADVDKVTDLVIGGAMEAEFAGATVVEWKGLVKTIRQRRLHDYYTSLAGKAEASPLPEEHEGSEDIWGEWLRGPGGLSAIEDKDLFGQALGELSEPHQGVVWNKLQGYSSKESAELINNHFGDQLDKPMTPDNVDKIFSRFRKRLTDLHEQAGENADSDQDQDDHDPG
jgi:hypothetical protein